MSASRERRERKALRDAGQTADRRVTIKKGSKTRDVITRWVVGIFVGIIVFTLAVLFLMGQGIPQRVLIAADVNGEKIRVNEMQFHYYMVYNNFVSSMGEYLSMFGFDASQPHDTQYFDEENGVTYKDYFLEQAMESVRSTVANAKDAEANGVSLSADDVSYIESYVAYLEESASGNGMTVGRFLTAMFGKGVTLESVRGSMERLLLSDRWKAEKNGSFVFSDEDVEAYYQANKDSYDEVSYHSLTITGAPAVEEGAAEPTEEESAAYLESASLAAEEMLSQVTADNFYETALEYCDESAAEALAAAENATLTENAALSGVSGDLGTWLADPVRAAGDKAVIEGTADRTVVLFLSRRLNPVLSADVRHILVSFRADPNDTADITAEEDAAARARAEELLQEWKDGAAAEESFADLANTYSVDPGSNTVGGLYESVKPGDMVAEFNDWVFDESRQPGDTGVVGTSYGYHIMYYVGQGEPVWKVNVRNTLITDAAEAYQESLLAGYTVTPSGFGIRFL